MQVAPDERMLELLRAGYYICLRIKYDRPGRLPAEPIVLAIRDPNDAPEFSVYLEPQMIRRQTRR